MGNLDSSDITSMMSPQQVQIPQPDSLNKTVVASDPQSSQIGTTFPPDSQLGRLSDYEYFNNLLLGQHWEAFNIRTNSQDYTRDYSKLRYITVNFAGLLSKVIADMLFSEPLSIKASDAGDQDWIDIFVRENQLDEQLYESALSNSALGDDIFKLRVGKRKETDEEMTVIFEETTPTIYFPEINGFNVRAEPGKIVLAWTFQVGVNTYLRQETHTISQIEHRVFLMKGNRIEAEADLSILGDPNLKGTQTIQETEINDYLVIHIPNWKTGNRHFGLSDYYDLDKLFFAINNRVSKIDNILDKHSDPILMIPDGVLDEEGKVKREALHMIEVPEGSGGKQKPEYIVWNANLEAAFSEVDKLVNFFMMTGEITPDVLGMGQGLNDSGRALKFKLMRTIAKAQRKKLYYDRAIKQLIYVAQELAQKHDLGIGPENHKLKGEPEYVDIIWQDGLPIDDYEEVTNEIAKIDAGLQSKKQAIMNLDNVDETAAEEKLEDIEDEKPTIPLPTMKIAGSNVDQNGNVINTTQSDPATAPEVKTPQKPVNDNSQPKKK